MAATILCVRKRDRERERVEGFFYHEGILPKPINLEKFNPETVNGDACYKTVRMSSIHSPRSCCEPCVVNCNWCFGRWAEELEGTASVRVLVWVDQCTIWKSLQWCHTFHCGPILRIKNSCLRSLQCCGGWKGKQMRRNYFLSWRPGRWNQSWLGVQEADAYIAHWCYFGQLM